MGYCSNYSLKQLRNGVSASELAALIGGDECARHALEPDGDTRQSEKWYRHEESLCAWSALHPDTVFCLHAEGEDVDGIWDKYFLAGKRIHTASFSGLPKPDLESLLCLDGSVPKPSGVALQNPKS